MPPSAKNDASRLSGAALLALAAVLFGLMAFGAKRVSAHLPGAQIAFLRFVIGLVATGIAGTTVIRLRPVGWRSLFLRGFFGGLAVLLFFTSIEKLPVGTATLLTYTAPIFTTIDAAIFLGERVTRATMAALALTMFGVVLVVAGHAAPGQLHLLGSVGRWELCAIGSAALSGAAITAVRLARRTDGPWEIFGAFCVFGTLATAPFAISVWRWPSATDWALVLFVGLSAVAAQVMFTRALRDVRAATAGVISQLTPVTALALGVALLGEPLGPLALVGSALTLFGVAWAARVEGRAPAEAVDDVRGWN